MSTTDREKFLVGTIFQLQSSMKRAKIALKTIVSLSNPEIANEESIEARIAREALYDIEELK